MGDVQKLIDDSDIIEGYPFVKLKYLIEFKEKCGLPKDLKDVKLIENYLKN